MISPAIRCLKQQLSSTIHLVCKTEYSATVMHNPHIDKVYTLGSNWPHLMGQLKSEQYDLIIDLHKTMRSFRMRTGLKAPAISFDKKSLSHRLHMVLPAFDLAGEHVIHRIFAGLKDLRLVDDEIGMEVYIDDATEQIIERRLNDLNMQQGYTVIALGGSHPTKRVPAALAAEYISASQEHIILLGGKDTIDEAREVMDRASRYVHNGVGQYSLLESFAIVKRCGHIITGDTGLMHFAAAADRNMVVVYGSTSPAFGMYPYYGKHASGRAHYLCPDQLGCWPCSKAGRPTCPKKHMNCLHQWKAEEIISKINKEPKRNSQA